MRLTFPTEPRQTNSSRFAWAIPAALLGLLATGCPAGKTSGSTGKTSVVIKGSNTFGETLAPRLISEYQKDHSDVTITHENRGTGSGFYSLFAGASDIAAASRSMIPNEQVQARIRGIQLNDYVIGAYSVVVIVNATSPLTNLAPDQVRDVFTGAIQNWKDLGGPDRPIHLFVRDPVSGTSLGFQELAMDNKPYATNITMLTTYAAIEDSIAKDENAIGYSTIYLAAKPGVKALSIGGISPSHSAVQQGKYPYARTLHLFTDKEKETPPTRDFVQFILSSRGQKIVDEMGFTPHS